VNNWKSAKHICSSAYPDMIYTSVCQSSSMVGNTAVHKVTAPLIYFATAIHSKLKLKASKQAVRHRCCSVRVTNKFYE